MRVLLAAMLLLVVGCGKSDEKKTVKTPGGSVTVEGDKVTVQTDKGKATIESKGGTTEIRTNEGTMTVGEGKVPDGFPLPVMRGAKVENSAHMAPPDGKEVFTLNAKIPAAFKDVADFYEKALKDKGLKVSRTEQASDDSQMVMLIGESETADGSVMVSKEAKADQPTAVISWSLKKK
jgi:hypothetical protein